MRDISRLQAVFGTRKPIVGMVHLGPLPGSARYDAELGMNAITEKAVNEAKQLEQGGVDGAMVENQWDRPFLKGGEIGYETVASMAAAIQSIRRECKLPLGVNVHLNGVCQALAIAVATGCRWVRAFELANAYVSNAGIIEAAGPHALRFRRALSAVEDILIFGDFHVKHGSHQIIGDRSLEEQAEDVQTALADALVITGEKTGRPPELATVVRIGERLRRPLLMGSGLSPANLKDFLPLIDGAIVGSYFKHDGNLENSVDRGRVAGFMDLVRKMR